MAKIARRLAKKFVPEIVKSWLWSVYRRYCLPAVGKTNFGNLRRLRPISRAFGFDRGLPIDRYYIEAFLQEHICDIQGHALEIGDNRYTKRFGAGKVIKSDVLDIAQDNQCATIIADLASADNIPSNTFDCIILTQTLQFVYNIQSALHHLQRILKSNGVLLATFSGISQISRYDMDRWGEYWRLTTLSAKRLFGEVFSQENVEVKAYGNVLSAISLLHGLAAKELKRRELDYHDEDYEVLITVRAINQKDGK